MEQIPFKVQLYTFIANKGSKGATVQEVNEYFSKHTPSSISGVLHKLKEEGRLKHISRGRYVVISKKRAFAKKTSLKDTAIRDIAKLRDSYKFDVSDHVTDEQLQEARMVYRSLNEVIEKLNRS